MTFWIIIGVIAVLVVLLFTRAALRGGADQIEAAAYDLQIYRDQLEEVDRDLARGVISEEEAERVRVEVSRRILTADSEIKNAAAIKAQPRRTGAFIALAAGIAVVGGAVALYRDLGTPGFADLPMSARIAASEELRANRMSQADAEARLPNAAVPTEQATEEFLALMERLRETVANRPDDLQGLSLLARNEAALGNISAAIAAQTQIIDVLGDEVGAADYTYLAELKISATGGYVSQEAEAALRAALALDATYPFARYYLAQYLMQVDRPDAAFRTLDALLKDSPEGAPWVMPIREQIEEIAWRAGVTYELPPMGDGPGPSAADIAAAQDMSVEDRVEMIRGMVAGLSERLANDGGTVDEWARLIRALGVLNDKDQADLIWTEAQQVFAEDPNALRTLYLAAQDAEIAQ